MDKKYALLEPPEFGMDLKMTTESSASCGISRPVHFTSQLVCDNGLFGQAARELVRKLDAEDGYRIVLHLLGPRTRVAHSFLCETTWRVQLVHFNRFGLWDRIQSKPHTEIRVVRQSFAG